MKKLIGIVVLGLLVIGNVYADVINLNCSGYKGYGDFVKDRENLGEGFLKYRIDTNKKTYEFKGRGQSKWTSMIILDWNGNIIKAIDPDPSYADTVEIFDFANQKTELIVKNKKINGYMQYICNKDVKISEDKQDEIMFTIKDKREQCEAIGFKPETEKFADCVLRLVELDVKKQQSNKIAQAQQSGNDALVKQLQRQQYDRGTDALLNLGQQLLNPGTTNSNIYMPQTQRCTIQGFGSFAKMVCI